MAEIEQYEALIIGSGEAGKYLAWTLAAQGVKTIVVERSMLGGSCPNVACLPSKNVIHSAKVVSLFERHEEFGIETEGWRVNMDLVRERKRKMVEGLMDIHRTRFRQSGAEVVMGTARFVGPKTVSVSLWDGGTRTLRGDKVFLNLGTRSTVPEIAGLADAKPLTHVEALELDVVPEHLVILGGGYIGLEFAQAFRRLGSKVTVVQRNERLVPKEDSDVSEELLRLLRKDGVDVLLGASPERVEGISGESVRVQIRKGGSADTIEGTHILVATGRQANTEHIGLEEAGVALSANGFIRVNERLETTAADVWAMGDCAGSPQFTHVSYDDFRVVRDNLAGGHRTTTDRLIPSTMFTDPQVARIGLNESEARAKGIPYRLAKLPMAGVLRTRTLSETDGFMKALISAEDDRILGFTALGVDAGEIMAMVQVAMIAGLPYMTLRDTIFTHPTLAEGLVFLFAGVPPRQNASTRDAVDAQSERATAAS